MAGSVHIKIDYGKAVSLKRDTLIVEKSLLEIIQHTRNYNLLRKKEFLLKTQLKRAMAEIESLIVHIEPTLPTEELKQVKLLEKPEKKEKVLRAAKSVKEKAEIVSRRNDIESQLEEIQAKLASLG
ncbi:hypothetical protein FJZ17_02100 [Candidatus Pacearchaeota archaeon]|nr:hypothetical protein [Candidatus Pacearchaeota archaeon]